MFKYNILEMRNTGNYRKRFTLLANKIGMIAYIAGGALRDLKRGQAPKDIDIFVRTGLNNTIDEVILKLEREFEDDFEVIERFNQADYGNFGNIKGVAKCKLMGIDVDIVLPTRRVYTVFDVASAMDFSINAIAMDWDGTICDLTPMEGDKVRMLSEARIERFYRFKEEFPMYDWTHAEKQVMGEI